MHRALVVIAFGVLLSGCGVGPGLKGNDTGGIIPYAQVDPRTAQEMAAAHCAQFGRLPKATSVDARYGGYYSFSCVLHPGPRSYARTRVRAVVTPELK